MWLPILSLGHPPERLCHDSSRPISAASSCTPSPQASPPAPRCLSALVQHFTTTRSPRCGLQFLSSMYVCVAVHLPRIRFSACGARSWKGCPSCWETLGMFLGSTLPEIWSSTRAIFLSNTNRSILRQKACKDVSDFGCNPNISSVLPKPFGYYLPMISSICAKTGTHGRRINSL